MQFKYFARPDLYTGFIEEETQCDICQKETKCFDASAFYGTEELNAICPECLATGKLYGKDVSTCNGDIAELRRQLKVYHPALSNSDIDRIAQQKTEELEKTTPHLVTWQDWDWPCLEGEYCTFIGYGSKGLYNRISNNGSEKDVFFNSLYGDLKEVSDTEQLWVDMPVQEINSYEESNDYPTLFYVFKSLKSDQIVTIWDCQ